jgi:hypothetical protein
MTGADLLRDAAAELYSSDPGEFVERRKALVARARAAGQAPAAKQIAGLRKPTRSAWIVNQLTRADPGAVAELAALGRQLRAAQGSLDGAALRDLSRRRRELIDSLARQAFMVSGQHAPPAAVRDEVAATLGAAVADPQVAGQLEAGTLERAAHAEGFGSAAPPALTLVKGAGRAARTPPAPPARPARPAAPAAGAARAERERRRREALAGAERAAAEASEAAATATAAEHAAEATVQSLEEQLADARSALARARARARSARSRQRSARQALGRLRG